MTVGINNLSSVCIADRNLFHIRENNATYPLVNG